MFVGWLFFSFLLSFILRWRKPNLITGLGGCCCVLLTWGWGRWARGKWSGFSPGATARHRSRTRVPRILPVFCSFYLSLSLFPLPFLRFRDRTSPQSEIGQLCPIDYFFLSFFLSFFLWFWRPNLITGLSGWWTPDSPLRTQETVQDQRTRSLLYFTMSDCKKIEWLTKKGKTPKKTFYYRHTKWKITKKNTQGTVPTPVARGGCRKPLRLPRARNEASNGPGIFSKTLCFGCAASGVSPGASRAPQGLDQSFRSFWQPFSPFSPFFFEIGRLPTYFLRSAKFR